ncbi:response regulator receiver domain [Bradyrhizobium sp. HKCCYLRH1030]|uniref:response regulator receiver domain n=1 Tax=Bradyrhizobium sp. HKCCYLRH1030 TaxID=3420744 RepID=UPI003EBF7A92
MADAAYESVVEATFQGKPLRTVLLVDDQFPTYLDLSNGETADTANRFVDKGRAALLYDAFQRNHMLCDVENVANDVRPERLRKSDLVVLDYHLGPGHNNSDRAIEILRELSISRHFNTVVVYTAEPDLDKVWLEIVAALSGGWTTLPAALTGDPKTHWERLSDERRLPGASKEAIMAYSKRRDLRGLPADVQTTERKQLIDLEVPQAACGDIIEALIHREMAQRSGRYAGEPKRATVGDYSGSNRWIQSGSVFVAIVQKSELTEDLNDPAGIMSGLRSALLAWKPNLIQILVSEIQNILELEALASEDELLKDPVTHTALWYYLLDALGPIDPQAPPDMKVAVMTIVDKIVDGVRRRLSSDPELLKLAVQALVGELRDTGWTKDTWPRGKTMLDGATVLARTKGLTTNSNTMFRLNSFSSTERFGRAHLTTGTIFKHAATDQYFVAASPACDLVARRPGADQWWTHSVHPITPLVAIMLNPVPIDKALEVASQGNHIFFERGSDKKAFKFVAGSGYQPPYEFFMLKDQGLVRAESGKTIFDASRLTPKLVQVNGETKASETEREWVESQFEVIAQLRGVNATHVLQMTGQHLSRVGLDFISTPSANG